MALIEYFAATSTPPALPCPHECTTDCRLWRQPGTNSYVCRATLSVHHCGSGCHHAIPSYNNEGMVCPLTGNVVGDVYPVLLVPGELNGNRVGCVSTTVQRRTRMHSRRDNSALRRLVGKALDTVFFSPARRQLEAAKRDRLALVIARQLRQGRTHADISAALYTRSNAFFCSRLVPSRRWADRLANAMVAHWNRYTFRPVRKTVFAFVLSVLNLLRHGRLVQTVWLFPACVALTNMLPQEQDTGRLLGITCRSVTKMTKTVISKSMHAGGTPNHLFIFPAV